MYEGLKRAQRSRLEDQRGTEINFELPDFLKDKENQTSSKFRKVQPNGSLVSENSRFYDGELTIVPKQSPDKIITPPIAMTRNLKVDNSDLKNESMSSRGFSSLENSMVESQFSSSLKSDDNLKCGDPPPLPPKPKVVPIKPSNWGHNNLFKMPREVVPKTDRAKHKLYLEHPTSSFV